MGAHLGVQAADRVLAEERDQLLRLARARARGRVRARGRGRVRVRVRVRVRGSAPHRA